MNLLQTIVHDLRFGIRALSRARWTTAITILSLALGIGVNTALFTAYKAFFLRSLDARDAHEMVNMLLIRNSGISETSFSYPDYEAYRDSVRGFSGIAAYRMARVTLSDAGGMISQRVAHAESVMGRLGLAVPTTVNAEFAQALVVSENYFRVLGVSAVRGRTFERMTRAGLLAAPSVLVSENYWQRRFAGDPAIVGKTVRLNGIAVTIIGITPRDFVGTGVATPAFWLPIGIEPLINGDSQWLNSRESRYRLSGRLAPGSSIAQAKAQLEHVAEQIWQRENPAAESSALATRPASMLVWPGSPFPRPMDQLLGVGLVAGLIMFGAGTVLCVACANVGSLQLARARSREAELRTRLSLGASRVRIIRQLLTESALVGLVAGGLALLTSWGLLKATVKAVADVMPVEIGTIVFEVNPDFGIFAFVLVISLIAGILSGLTPAMQSPRSPLTSIGRAVAGSIRRGRIQGMLVAAQVALSLLLMIIGCMFVRGAINARGMESGYDADNVVRLDLQFPTDSTFTSARRIAAVNELRRRVAGLGVVTGVTIARPPGGSIRTAAVPIDEGKGVAVAAQSILSYTFIEPSYFETLGVPLRLGRGFGPDTGNGQFVVLSESAAKQLFGGENPLGRNIRLGQVDGIQHRTEDLIADGPLHQVIGVSGDTRGFVFDGSDSKQIYLPLPDSGLASRPVLIRTHASAVQAIAEIERVAASVDPGIIVSSSTLEEALRGSPPFFASGVAAAIATSIGLFGLLLALIGIFGTVSHIVALRTREVGIRIAIGAQRSDVLKLILREIARPVVAGLTAGMVLAFVVVYLMRGVIYGISAVDSVYFVAVASAFFIVAVLASLPPARRAMRVDPVVALRYD